MTQFQKYIIPIETGHNMGIGFLVKNYFVTAGHLFRHTPVIKFNFANQSYSLNVKDAIFLEDFDSNGTSEDQLDLVVFELTKTIQSPLQFTMDLPSSNGPMTLLTLNHKRIGSIFSPDIDPYDFRCLEGTFVRNIHNFFECEFDGNIKEGHSGSPLIRGNQVFGVLSGCLDQQNHPERILFCSIKKLMSYSSDLEFLC